MTYYLFGQGFKAGTVIIPIERAATKINPLDGLVTPAPSGFSTGGAAPDSSQDAEASLYKTPNIPQSTHPQSRRDRGIAIIKARTKLTESSRSFFATRFECRSLFSVVLPFVRESPITITPLFGR